MKPRQLKVIGIVVLIVMLLNLVLAAFREISWMVFWVVIILGAVLAYKVLPRMKEGWEK